MNKSDKHWEKYGKEDPYYWVTTLDKYHGQMNDEEKLKQFFQEGEEYGDKIFQIIRNRLSPDFAPKRILDYGCGVGRIIIPMAKNCESAVGTDISSTMLEKAQLHCDEMELNHVKLVQSDDALSKVEGTFDFIHSIYVFQHIPIERGLKIFKRMLGKLNPGGVAMLQFTYCSDMPKGREFLNWVKMNIPLALQINNLLHLRAPDAPMMEMHRYPLNRIERILHEFEKAHTYVRFTKDGNYRGVMLFIQLDKSDDKYVDLPPIP